MAHVVAIVRRERAADVEATAIVHTRAFAARDREIPVEVRLLAALRESAAWIPELSLVATVAGAVVGHVVCTRAHVGDAEGPRGGTSGAAGGQPAPAGEWSRLGEVVALGPIGVLPSFQGKGLGHALVHAVVAAAEARGEPLVGLLGSADFYGRFGFVPAGGLGIDAPDPAWGEHFQARPLAAYARELIGTFRYAPPFEAL